MKRRKPKAKQFNMRMNAEDERRLDRLAAYYALSRSSVLMMLVKRDHDRIGEARSSGPVPMTEEDR